MSRITRLPAATVTESWPAGVTPAAGLACRALPGGTPRRGRPSSLSRRVDNGLRLLVHQGDARQVRWTTDPDAPAARNLFDGQARLVLRRALLLAMGLSVRQASAPVAQPCDLRKAPLWAGLPVVGLMVVIESRTALWPVGRQVMLSTTLRTHQVVSAQETNLAAAIGCSATASACPAAGEDVSTAAQVQDTRAAQLLHGKDVTRGRELIEEAWRKCCAFAELHVSPLFQQAGADGDDPGISSSASRGPILVSPWTRIRSTATLLHPSLPSH